MCQILDIYIGCLPPPQFSHLFINYTYSWFKKEKKKEI